MLKCALVFVCLFMTSLEATSKYPVDISFLVADIKYSKEYGIKICEIQQGILCNFKGDLHLNGESGIIQFNFFRVLSNFPIKKWAVVTRVTSNIDKSKIDEANNWDIKEDYSFITDELEAYAGAKKQPKNPTDISSYYGMVYARADNIRQYQAFQEKYPGIVVMDAASFPYWIDKYKMSELFNRNTILSAIKPEWRLYPKKYTETLAQNIIDDIQSDWFVIKPRGSFLGNGVIIVSQENLNSTLKYILHKSDELKNNSNKAYKHWYKDPFDSFIVEKFYPSDLITMPN